jgi:predicted anti-sigma-YlaC factor YlaD
MRSKIGGALFLLWLIAASGCSIRKMAVNSLADALAESSSVYATDSDLELVRDALPFGLKTIETLLVKVPRHRGLLVSAASGFAQYGYAFVELDAEAAKAEDPSQARELRLRAKGLYLRARDFGIRALELDHPGIVERLRADPKAALAPLKLADVPELYWTLVAWAGAIASNKEDMDLVADLHLIEPMVRRCVELDEDYDAGALHEFLVSFEGGRSESQGGSAERARRHSERALQLSGNRKLGPLVSLAETVSVSAQDRREFEQLLQQCLAFDVNSAPEYRLSNLLAQKRARLLLAQIDDLFIEN